MITERQFVDQLEKAARKGKRKPAALTEINAHHGIADLVLVYSTMQNKTINREVLANYINYKTLSYMPYKKWIELVDLKKYTNVSAKYLKDKILKMLLKYKYIKTDGKKYYRQYKMKQKNSKIVAIEVKLEKWERAVYQALRYKTFANYVYIAMPYDNAKKYSQKSIISNYGVGVMTIKDGNLLIVKKAKYNIPVDKVFSKYIIEYAL